MDFRQTVFRFYYVELWGPHMCGPQPSGKRPLPFTTGPGMPGLYYYYKRFGKLILCA